MNSINARRFGFVTLCLATLAGCLETTAPLEYLGNEPFNYYVGQATQIDEPCLDHCPSDVALATDEPRSLRDRREDEIWDMSLAEAIHRSLGNATVVRANGSFGNSPLLSNGAIAQTVHDPAIQSSTVAGNVGVEAALSSFDTDFTTNMTWGRDERVQNSPFSPAGAGSLLSTLAIESAAFTTGLSKRAANGATLSLTHDMNYQGVPPGLFPFPSSYSGSVNLGYRQPLWAGGGVEYTRIAGPISGTTANTRNVLGQGVVLARINENISLDDFEAAVRDLVLDTETVYWDLYLQYRLYNAAVQARNAALGTWRQLHRIKDSGGGDELTIVNESQARDQYFTARASAEQALAGLYATEVRFRRLLGLGVNDGRVIRPMDEPLTAPIDTDWHHALAEALVERVELRRQKWNIKALELQLIAARKLVSPRLDFVSSYNVNAFGDQLLGYGSDDDAVGSAQGLRYAYESLTQGNQTGWTLGFEFSMPIGFRHAHSQVRNVELQLVKARDVLAAQELEISHELATAYQSVYEHYQRATTNYNRRGAAVERLEKTQRADDLGGFKNADSKDFVLRAQTSVAQAERDYYTSLVEYNKAIANLQYRKGTLLEFNHVFLQEGEWDCEAYGLALRRAEARSNAIDAEGLLRTEPGEFASPGRFGGSPFALLAEPPADEVPFGHGPLGEGPGIDGPIPHIDDAEPLDDAEPFPSIPAPRPATPEERDRLDDDTFDDDEATKALGRDGRNVETVRDIPDVDEFPDVPESFSRSSEPAVPAQPIEPPTPRADRERAARPLTASPFDSIPQPGPAETDPTQPPNPFADERAPSKRTPRRASRPTPKATPTTTPQVELDEPLPFERVDAKPAAVRPATGDSADPARIEPSPSEPQKFEQPTFDESLFETPTNEQSTNEKPADDAEIVPINFQVIERPSAPRPLRPVPAAKTVPVPSAKTAPAPAAKSATVPGRRPNLFDLPEFDAPKSDDPASETDRDSVDRKGASAASSKKNFKVQLEAVWK